MIAYAAQFMSLSTMDYRSVWWRLFHAPTCAEWSNALNLARLLFSLPVSNGKLERVFSQLNLIKTSRRSTLSDESLQDLMTLNANKIPLQEFFSRFSHSTLVGSKMKMPKPVTEEEVSTPRCFYLIY